MNLEGQQNQKMISHKAWARLMTEPWLPGGCKKELKNHDMIIPYLEFLIMVFELLKAFGRYRKGFG